MKGRMVFLKQVALVVALALVLTGTVFPPSSTAYAAKEHTGAAELLNKIGISAVDDETSFITRGDFAVLAVQALNSGHLTDEEVFSDVSGEQGKFINTAAKLGLVSVNSEKRFEPDRIITVEEAAAICLRVLGYELIMKNPTYPASYLMEAGRLNIIEPKAAGTKLTGADATDIIFNMLRSKYVRMHITSNDDKNSYSLSNATYLEDVFDVYRVDGVITSVCGLSLAGKARVDGRKIAIDSVSYQNPYYTKSETYRWLGKDVVAYVIEKDGGRELLYMEDRGTVEKITSDKITKVVGFDAGDSLANRRSPMLSYEEGDRVVECRIDPNATVVLNGVPKISISNADLMPALGVVYLTDNNNDDVYDVVIVESYTYYYVLHYNPVDKIIVDKYGKQSIKLKEFKESNVEVWSGEKLADDNLIAEGSVLEIMATFKTDGKIDNKNLIRIKPVTMRVEAPIEVIKNDKFLIDGKLYDAIPELWSDLSKRLGQTGKFHIGVADTIVAYEEFDDTQALNYGYLVAVQDFGTLEHDFKFRIFTIHEEMIDVEMADVLRYTGYYNGEYVVGRGFKEKNIGGVIAEKQLVRFQLNEEGKLAVIETAYDHTKDTYYKGFDDSRFTLDYSASNASLQSGMLSGGYMVAAEAPVFFVSTTSNNVNDFKVRSLHYLGVSASGFSLKAYDTNKSLAAQVAVFEDTRPSMGSENIIDFYTNSNKGVVKEVCKVMDEEGEIRTKIKIQVDRQEQSFMATEEDLAPTTDNGFSITRFDELEFGDIIGFRLSPGGKIQKYAVLNEFVPEDEMKGPFFKGYEMAFSLASLAKYQIFRDTVSTYVENSNMTVGDNTDKLRTERTNPIVMDVHVKAEKVTRYEEMPHYHQGDIVWIFAMRGDINWIVRYIYD